MAKDGTGKKRWRRPLVSGLVVMLCVVTFFVAPNWQPESTLQLISAAAKRPLIAKALPASVLNMTTGGHTPLTWAIHERHDVELVKALLAAGADPNGGPFFLGIPLWLAVTKPDIEMARALLAAGADVDALDAHCWALAVSAATKPDIEMARTVLGADAANIAYGKARALVAAATGHSEVELLLEAHADVNARDNDGRTALMAAAMLGVSPKVIQALLAAGADVNAKDESGNTALHEAGPAGNPQVVRMLLAAGADAKSRNVGGKTALARATRQLEQDEAELGRTLLNAGADSEKDQEKLNRARTRHRNMSEVIQLLRAAEGR